MFKIKSNNSYKKYACRLVYVCMYVYVCVHAVRGCVWIGLANILFIDESMAVHFFFGFIIWNYSRVRYNT